MSPRKKLSSVFAAAALAMTPIAAYAQDQAPAPATTEAPVQAATAAPVALPDLNTFKVSDYLRGTDSRPPLYLCGDNTRDCWTPAERTAGDVREFQQMLIATTLTCRSRPGNQDLTEVYNTFFDRHTTTLSSSYHLVGARFTALAGAPRPGMRAQDTLDTATINMFSSATNRDGFCETASQLLRHLATVEDSTTVTAIASRVMEGSRGTYAPNDPAPPLAPAAPPVPGA